MEKANLRTLVTLLKKTEFLLLNRLEVTWPILQIILDNDHEFENIKGLHLEYHPNYHELFIITARKLGGRLTGLSLVEATVKYPNPLGYLDLAEAFL